MRTYKEQTDAVKKRIYAHDAKRRKTIKGLYATTSVFIIAAAVTVTSATVLSSRTKNNTGVSKYGQEVTMDTAEYMNGGEEDDYAGTTIEESASTEATDFEVITGTQFYGKIAESKRSDSEIEKLSGEDSDIITAYEDERYIYFFYADGTLHSVLNMSEGYTEQYMEADSESIKQYAETVIKRYLSAFNSAEYEADVQHDERAFPAWDITYTQKSGGITVEKIIIRFVSNGDMYYLQRETSFSSASVNLSAEKAAEIALGSLNKKYGLDISDAYGKYNISVFTVPKENDPFYTVEIDGIPVKHGDFETKKAYWVKVSALTGAVLNISESR